MGSLDDVIASIAPSQAGVITRSQCVSAGVSDVTLRRALDRHRLRRSAVGVYVVTGSPATRHQELWVAHLGCGPTSVLSHWTAGRESGLAAMLPSDITVSIPHHRVIVAPGVVVHRSRRLGAADVEIVAGLPFTTPARTVVDLAGECREARLAAIVDSAHFSGRATYCATGEALLRCGGRGKRGSGRLARVLDERVGDPLSQSQLEVLLGEVVRAAGLVMGQDAVRQHPLPSTGSIAGTVDLFLPGPLVIVEADGRRWHQRQTDMKRDRERDFAAAQVGVLTVRLLHEHLSSDLDGCVAGLRRVIASRELGGISSTPV